MTADRVPSRVGADGAGGLTYQGSCYLLVRPETRLLAMGGEIGWGAFALERLGSDELVVSVRNSPFARAYGAAVTPVCHLTRGVLERLAEVALGAPAVATETACAANGAPACRFVARVR
ncbi:MAG: hypothetical protein AUG87_12140 [Candidatus Rokubacteria bacterium 13_1_20CM_4_70_14]|nr:MAG: hypothetical protein AUG87_12140 [Candidatus Rokubacteria bacterium 13_1_20CM_4_70_14]